MNRRTLAACATAFATGIVMLSATPAFALSRTEVMARARKWVDLAIPYSQTFYRDDNGATATASVGWRCDCSGFVSMTWKTSHPGLSTRTLHYVSTVIPRELLQPGDALVSYDNHAVLFGGWANAERTHYYAYEMSSSASRQSTTAPDGTVIRVTPYPYWSWPADRPYVPYRRDGVTGSIDYEPYIQRVQGANRYETAVAASRAAFPDGASAAVIVSGEDWPDALSASSLAGALGGPVLLSASTRLPAAVAEEVQRLQARSLVVVGGPSAVATSVVEALKAIPGVSSVKRVAGSNRYETARAVADETRRIAGAPEAAFLCTGENFPDALAAAPLAYASGWPVLLTQTGALSEDASAVLVAARPQRVYVLGGEAVVSTQTVAAAADALGPAVPIARVAGPDRYDTALRVAALGVDRCGLSYAAPAIATGDGFADALAGGAMAGARKGVLLLTPTSRMYSKLWTQLAKVSAQVGKPFTLGGDAALSPTVRTAIALALEPVRPPQ
ncbi:MAG: cell wall-binding repeat-containing protein [Anaerosomatales bacterium]|nr:cell wall-binding repeat-containing protein [Anaerosomatales bacterium]